MAKRYWWTRAGALGSLSLIASFAFRGALLAALLAASVGCKKTGEAPKEGAAADDKKSPEGGKAEAQLGAGGEAAKEGTGPAAEPGAGQPAVAAGGAWTDFSSAEGRFSAKFPSAPESQVLPTPTAVGNVEQKMFSVTSGMGFYAASFADYPETAMKDAVPATVLDGARDGAVKNVQGKLVKEDQIAIDGHPGRYLKIEATPQGQAIDVEARIFLVKNRLYQMIVVRPRGSGGDADVSRFLGSFKLVAAAN
jgi:hypothetical protein